MKRTAVLIVVAVLAAAIAAGAAPVAATPDVPAVFAVPAAPAPAAARWVIQPTPSRHVPGNELFGVSCTSPAACTAVGYSGAIFIVLNAPDKPRPVTLAQRWDGRRWTIQPTPNPSGASISVLFGVSCAARQACTAVGDAETGKVVRALAERWDGRRWTIQPTPSPAGAVFSTLAGVSCPASGECVAVGYSYRSLAGPIFAFTERWNGTRWALGGTIAPAGASETFLNSVSCPATRRCTAVGSFDSVPGGFRPLAEAWNGVRWQRQPMPGTGELHGVWCRPVSCAAVGEQPAHQGLYNVALAMRWNGRRWAAQPMPDPRGATQTFLYSVSCPTAASCTAVGFTGGNLGVLVAERWNGVRWILQAAPNPKGSELTVLNGVSCGSPAACEGAGVYNLPSGTKTLAEIG